jgi:microcystin-dependent protein
MHPGQGKGLSLRDLGEVSGTESVTLLDSEMPVHSHTWGTTNQTGEDRTPANETLSKAVGGNIYGATTNLVQFNVAALPPAGGSLPHNNMQPYLTLNFCIALQGVFPPRT